MRCGFCHEPKIHLSLCYSLPFLYELLAHIYCHSEVDLTFTFRLTILIHTFPYLHHHHNVPNVFSNHRVRALYENVRKRGTCGYSLRYICVWKKGQMDVTKISLSINMKTNQLYPQPSCFVRNDFAPCECHPQTLLSYITIVIE